MSSAYDIPVTKLGDALRETRVARDLYQAEVAAQLGVSQRTLQNWEAGGTPRAAHRRRIRQWLAAETHAEDVA